MAVVTSAVVVGASTVYAANKGSKAAKEGAKAQVEAADKGVELQRESRDIARQDLQPYSDMGKESINRLQQLAQPGGTQSAPQINRISLNPATKGITGTYGGERYENGRIVQNTTATNPSGTEYGDMREGVTLDPNFSYDRKVYDDSAGGTVDERFNEAADVVADQVSARQAAQGKLGSGNTLVDLFRENTMLKEGLTQGRYNRLRGLEDRDRMNINQDSNLFNNDFVRNMDVAGLNQREIAMKDGLKGAEFNRNLNLVKMGQASAAGQAATTTNAGNSIANLYGQQGNAIAAGKIGSANAYAGGVNNLAGLAGLYAYYDVNKKPQTTTTKTINTDQPMGLPMSTPSQDFYKYFV